MSGRKVTKFFSDNRTRLALKNRAPLPPETKVRTTRFMGSEVTLGLFDEGNKELGTVSYFIGNANSLAAPLLAQTCPWIYKPVSATIRKMPKLLIITSFDSNVEHETKGVGSAMLRELVKVAELSDCFFIVVQSGVNHEVYTALGFELIDKSADIWCMPVSHLRSRLSPLRRIREAP